MSKEIIDVIYKNRKNFILLGLTGRIGSGCTTAAEFLSKTVKDHNLKDICIDDKSHDAKRKKYIIHEYYKKHWYPFEIITMSDIITLFIFKNSYKELEQIISSYNKSISEANEFFKNIKNNKINHQKDKEKKYKRFKNFNYIKFKELITSEEYEKLRKEFKDLLNLINDKNTENLSKKTIKKFWKKSKKFKEFLQKESYKNYTDLYQLCGDNIRLYGDIKINAQSINPENIYIIAEITNKIIKIYRKENNKEQKPTYIVLDAIRNVLEAYYFKERYSAFYLIAINSKDNDIKARLMNKDNKLSKKDIENILNQEDKTLEVESIEDFISQNIKTCIVNSDIFIKNDGSNINDNSSKLEMYGNLIKYVSLIQHPGLITPSHDELMMQIAFTAKLNSGCISRQVGACVINKYGSIKAVGWNDVAEGQTPCILRSASELLQSSTSNSYSLFEKQDIKFKECLKNEYQNIESIKDKGLNDSYCFKKIYTNCNEKQHNNQVHTRALHAEENAFLQLAKYGSGESIIGGTLYSTASPCELCSKKAYQLGIKRIVYIDPYPGIAKENILNSGQFPPDIELFTGAIGTAFHKLYTQIIPYKDEIYSIMKTK
jgi:dCMP deaminase